MSVLPEQRALTLPRPLKNKLGRCPYGGAVLQAYQNFFTHWIERNDLFFFPEFTDHGPQHVESVLQTASALISKSAARLLAPTDAAVLVLATLLHDVAMHLTADGFLALLDGPRDRIGDLDDTTWPKLFDDFYAEARHWDGRTLYRILGDAAKPPDEQGVDLYTFVQRPSELSDPENWSTRHRKFFGEFVRRHHGRLAHEIAMFGAPGPADPSVMPPPDTPRLAVDGVPADIRNLAGFVARSHSIALRDTFSFLQSRFNQRVYGPDQSHPVFLMAVLRIADYLQIDPSRAPAGLMQVKAIRSPISREEWAAHFAVDACDPDEEDAEALLIRCTPRSSETFLKLSRLLSGLQAELDNAWAVLGQVYSKQRDCKALGLTIRRVRSNLDDSAKFTIDGQPPPYYPLEAKFDTAGADLLKLLIRPLYGDRPEIGVRELIQNAVDAVRELEQYCENHNLDITNLPLPDQDADVLIELAKDAAGVDWLTVIDRGIGMTPEVVRDYFLKAGASYRDAPEWKQEHMDGQHARVLRSGRFGVGLMAVFLLVGDQRDASIEVRTCHVSRWQDRVGVEFTASLADTQVELRRCENAPVGTRVRVHLSPGAATGLRKWPALGGWFTWAVPRVLRRIDGRTAEPELRDPAPSTVIDRRSWCQIEVPGLSAVAWSFGGPPILSVNGIRVASFEEFGACSSGFGSDACLRDPQVTIEDPDAVFPLTLQRDSLQTGVLPFARTLLQDVARDLAACLVCRTPREPPRSLSLSRVWRHGDRAVSLVATQRGLLLSTAYALFAEKLPALLEVEVQRGSDRIHLPSPMYAVVLLDSPLIKSQDRPAQARAVGKHIGEDAATWAASLNRDIRFVDVRSVRESPSGSDKAFQRVLGPSLLIPYDWTERKRKFARAFEELAPLIEVWQRDDLTGWRRELVDEFKAMEDPA